MRYRVSGQHANGKSVDHCCTYGVYGDPGGDFDAVIEADSPEDAEQIAYEQLCELVEEAEPCRCCRQLQPGSESWWNSVCLTAIEEPA